MVESNFEIDTLKIDTLKPLESFQNYFWLEVSSLVSYTGLKPEAELDVSF